MCARRMPADLASAVARAESELAAAVEAGETWLRQHPHASEREIQCIALASQGLGNAEIAERLGVSVDLVKDQFRQVSARWGCKGRANVVATAFRLGYLKLEIPRGVIAR